MSNSRPYRRRLSRAQAEMLDLLGPGDGEPIPGGCEDCTAYQTTHPVSPGVWRLAVHHDPGCPQLARARHAS